MPEARRLEVDAAALKALAHPLRVRILQTLDRRGQVSATSLAAELGESTGATSYHLRQLARHGMVEQADAPAGAPRQRWWRMAVDELHVQGFDFLADASTRDAANFLLRETLADRTARLRHWWATATEWPEPWQAASTGRDGHLVLDPTQTRALSDDLAAVIARYRELAPGEDAREVDFHFEVFPQGDPPGDVEDQSPEPSA